MPFRIASSLERTDARNNNTGEPTADMTVFGSVSHIRTVSDHLAFRSSDELWHFASIGQGDRVAHRGGSSCMRSWGAGVGQPPKLLEVWLASSSVYWKTP